MEIEGKKYMPCTDFCRDPAFYIWLGRDAILLDLMTAAVQTINRALVGTVGGEPAAVWFRRTGAGGLEIVVGTAKTSGVRHVYVQIRMDKEQTVRLAKNYNYRQTISTELKRGVRELFMRGVLLKGLKLNGIRLLPGLPGKGVLA